MSDVDLHVELSIIAYAISGLYFCVYPREIISHFIQILRQVFEFALYNVPGLLS